VKRELFAFARRLGLGELSRERRSDGVLREMLSRIPFDPRDFVVVTVGSCPGEVPILEASRPFRRVVRAEGSEDFRLPEEPLLLWIFHPFDGASLARVLEDLESSLQAIPRRAYVLVGNPAGPGEDRRAVFEAAGFLRVLVDDPGYTIYTAS
jgi:hypothetical protein